VDSHLRVSAYTAQKCALRSSRLNSMIRLVNGSLTQVSVWIDCPTCGRYQKLAREVDFPFEVMTPMLERACAVCKRCQGIAVMCFERKGSRLH
jgi:hypothetical protein